MLLELSDTARATLKISSIPGKDLETLDTILEVMLADELSSQATELSVIARSRFDKLIEELVTDKKHLTGSPRLADIISKASSLQHKWQQRFKAAYFSIDEDRLKEMKDDGALHDVVPEQGDRKVPHIWRVVRRTPMMDSDIKPGM